MPRIQSTAHSATVRPSLYSTLSWALGIILVIQAVKPPRKGSSEILMSLNGRNHKHSFAARLVSVRGLGLSWIKLWRIQVLLHIGGGQMTNTSRGTSPVNGSVSPWVRMWAAQERKTKTVFAQELHWDQFKGRKQPEFREAGSHSAAADISDKQKGKKWKRKNTSPNPKWTNWASYSTASSKAKLSVKVTQSKAFLAQLFWTPEPGYGESFKESPWSSSGDVSGCAGTEELQWGARVAQHSATAQLCPLLCKHKGLGCDMRAAGLVFNFSV